jgi:hypothetical protein
MPPVEFEPTISAGEWPQVYALDHTATGTGTLSVGSIILKPKYRSSLGLCFTLLLASQYMQVVPETVKTELQSG